MTRAQMLLVFAAAGIVAIVAGVITAVVIAGRNNSLPSREYLAGSEATVTQAVDGSNSATAANIRTPMPFDSLRPSSLMFCEPLREPGGTRVATIDPRSGARVVFVRGGCEPDLDRNRTVLVRNGDGSMGRASVSYVPVRNVFTPQLENIVWTPARGTLDGSEVIMTGRYLRDASVQSDSLGTPTVVIRMTHDGRQVFGSLSERLIGYPLAIFVDSQPLRSQHGEIIAPTVRSRIEETITIRSVGADGSNRLAALINSGLAQ